MISTDDLSGWLRLLETPGVGRITARKLLAAFGSPQAVWAAPRGARAAVVGPVLADALSTEPERCAALVDATEAWLNDPAANGHRHVITLGDPSYPHALLNQADPPLLLYAHGRVELLQAPAIAVVGSRHATAQGLDNARAFAEHLSQAGLTVVSGLALGIDGAAHEGALTGPGSTIAVVGTGLDRVYPSRHRSLAHRIAREGLLLSEFPMCTEPLGVNFPQRNRIIAGLSLGTLVVEAAVQSGSLITARMALDGGRDVFAIPGSIHAPQSRGCHALIRQGAKLVECGQDILDELQPFARRGTATAPDTAAKEGALEATSSDEADTPRSALLYALGHDPVSLDALAARTGWTTAQLNTQLLELELQDQVARLPGQLFQRRAAG